MTHSKRCASFSLSCCISIWPNFEGGVHPIIWLECSQEVACHRQESQCGSRRRAFQRGFPCMLLAECPNCCKLTHRRIISKAIVFIIMFNQSSLVYSCLLSPIQSISLSWSTAESRTWHQHQSSLLSQERWSNTKFRNCAQPVLSLRCMYGTKPNFKPLALDLLERSGHLLMAYLRIKYKPHCSSLPSSLRGYLIDLNNMHSSPILCQTRQEYL